MRLAAKRLLGASLILLFAEWARIRSLLDRLPAFSRLSRLPVFSRVSQLPVFSRLSQLRGDDRTDKARADDRTDKANVPQVAPFTTSDPEFLPAALEILVTPPSPIAMSLMALISVLVVAGLAWAYFGWLDIYAVAPGKIQPSGFSKVVQPLEPGRVVSVRVENGSQVKKGDILVELDPTEAAANRAAQLHELAAASGEAARRRAAVAAVDRGDLRPRPIDFLAEVDASVRQRETAVLGADLAQLRATVGDLQAQISQKAATKKRLEASLKTLAELVSLARERVAIRAAMQAKGAGSRAQWIDKQEQLVIYLDREVSERGQIAETDAAVVSIQQKIDETLRRFVADQWQKIAKAEQQHDQIKQALIKARWKDERMVLRAPIDGTVQQLAVTTVGQVVTTGQALMTVVPLQDSLKVAAMVANKDIGMVKVGQEAQVKVEAFPFTRYGVVNAKVIRVARDAVDTRDSTALQDAAAQSRPRQAAVSSSVRAQQLVFPTTLELKKRTINVDGKAVPLMPGMAVTVEIKTGERRAIDFIMSPLTEMTSNAGRER